MNIFWVGSLITCAKKRGPPTHALLVIRESANWRNAAWWRAVQQAAEIGGKKRRVFSPEWRHAVQGEKPLHFDDPFVFCFGEKWAEVFADVDKDELKKLRSEFFVRGVDFVGSQQLWKPSEARKEPISLENRVPKDKPMPMTYLYPWDQHDGHVRVQILGDSQVACSWLNCTYAFAQGSVNFKNTYRIFQDALFEGWNRYHYIAKDVCSDFCLFLHRKHNTIADACATSGIDGFGSVQMGKGHLRHGSKTGRDWKFIRVWFDGGFHDNKMGAGVVVQVAEDYDENERLPNFELLFKFGTRLRSPGIGNSMVAETCAAGLGLIALFEVLHSMHTPQHSLTWTPYCRPDCRSICGRKCMRAIEDLLHSLG